MKSSSVRFTLLILATVVLSTKASDLNVDVARRQIFNFPGTGNDPTNPNSPNNPNKNPLDPGQSSPTTPPTTPTTGVTQPTQPNQLPSTTTSSSSSTSSTPASTTSTSSSTTSSSQSVQTNVSTDSQGAEVTVTNTVVPTAPASTPTTASSDSSSNPKPSSGVGQGTIIGLSVAGGIALLCIVGFLIWKLRKRRSFNDFDDNEAIKWPDLNRHTNDQYALPTNNTGRAGFETSGDLSRAPSITSYNNGAAPATTSSVHSAPYSMAAASSSDVYGADPYHVPPLPHHNPNIPPTYRDDPNASAAGAFYDPYSGTVPVTLHDPEGPSTAVAGSNWNHVGEAIPMTQMSQRSRSPGPAMAYDAGRGSPAPPTVGRRSPGPGMAYEGTPAPAYGSDPYNNRRPTGPNIGYDNYGAR